jgi:hypothetical protein
VPCVPADWIAEQTAADANLEFGIHTAIPI